MKIYKCTVYWLSYYLTFCFPALDSQDFINKLKEGLANTNYSTDYKISEVTIKEVEISG
jgi:hypothetical protein